jgi:multidrug resistance efflux pump
MGRLEYLGVREGSTVREGEVIARIKSNDYRAALAAARAAPSSSGSRPSRPTAIAARRGAVEAQRHRGDRPENARTKRASASAAAEAAKADAALAQANFDHTSVRAPFAGTVLRKDAEVGEIVAPSSAGAASPAPRS